MSRRILLIYVLLLISTISYAAVPNTSIPVATTSDKSITESALPESILLEKAMPETVMPETAVTELPTLKQSEPQRILLDNLVTEELSKQVSTERNSFILTQQQWAVPKSVQSILRMPALRGVMQGLLKNERYRLVIRYPGGEVGILWASELKAWLVSLGVASGRIELQSGSLNSDELKLFVNKSVLH